MYVNNWRPGGIKKDLDVEKEEIRTVLWKKWQLVFLSAQSFKGFVVVHDATSVHRCGFGTAGSSIFVFDHGSRSKIRIFSFKYHELYKYKVSLFSNLNMYGNFLAKKERFF
jgi:hypothetical protein